MHLALLAIWAAFLVVLLVSRARPHEPLFWLLLVPSLLAGGGAMWVSSNDSRKARRMYAQWQARLATVGALTDVPDDGHLYEWFDQPEWDRIFQALERMPPGARSLRAAIATVDPESVGGP
jgi:hypothetical protein